MGGRVRLQPSWYDKKYSYNVRKVNNAIRLRGHKEVVS